MRNKLFKTGFIPFVCAWILAVPFSVSAQQASPETGIRTVAGSEMAAPSNRLSALSASSSITLWRYPSEEKQWLQMTNATAYFRDEWAGASMSLLGIEDGETWDAIAQRPDGSTFAWPTITYNQASNCFVASYGGWSACG